MNQPTLANIPDILTRTILRLAARIILALAAVVLLIGTALALLSLLIATWRTPRGHRTQLAVDIALAVTALAKSRKSTPKSA